MRRRINADPFFPVPIGAILINLLFLILIGCSATKKIIEVPAPVVTEVFKDPVLPKTIIQDTVPPTVFKIDTLLKLNRGACIGKCPVYEYSILNDGTVLWNGLRYTGKLGTFVAKLNQTKIKELQQLITKATVWSLRDFYPVSAKEKIPDFPSIVFKFYENNQVKRIEINNSIPADLKLLDKKITEWLENTEWMKIEP